MDEVWSALRRWMDRPLFRWFLGAYLAVGAIGVAVTLLSDMSLRQEYIEYELRSTQDEQRQELADLKERIVVAEATLASLETDPASIAEVDKLIAAAGEFSALDAVSLSERLERVESRASQTHEELGEFKSALNPTMPEDALKVLRLGDKFELYGRELDTLKDQVAQLRTDLGDRIERNHERAIGRVDAITGTIGWMALLLVPVMLGAVREFFSRKSGGDGD